MNLCTLAYTSGSFCFTQASLEAVKLPGELSRCGSTTSAPSASKALLPTPTARLSHQIIEGRSTFISLSTTTSPCIWYEIPMALTWSGVTLAFFITACEARQAFCHHCSGCCSAKPGCGAAMGISVSGKKAEATAWPVSAWSRQAFTDELPRSNPRKYIGCKG